MSTLESVFKYVMLRTVTKNSTIIITKYTWYHRYREIIQITGWPPLWLHWKPDSKAGRKKLKCSDVKSALSRLTWIIVSLERYFWAILNHLPLIRFRLTQTDMVVDHSWHNFNKIMLLSSGIILSSHLFTCLCMGWSDIIIQELLVSV